MLKSMCQFLAMTNEEKLHFLPAIRPDVSYVINECGDRTDNPLLYYCNAICELTDSNQAPYGSAFAEVVADISSLLAVMIEQSAAYPCIWFLNKRELGVFGTADRLWNVLRRLAIQALNAQSWPREYPSIPFAETEYDGSRKETNPGANPE